MMTLVGGEVVGFLSPNAGVLCILIIVILSIFLSTLCLDCGKRSFELRDRDVKKNPSTLVRVVKLEEAMAAGRVNPMINEIQNDEMESTASESGPEDNSWYQPWRSHLQSPSVGEQIGNGSPGAVKMSDSSLEADINMAASSEPHLFSSLPPSTTTLDTEGSTVTDALTSTLNAEGAPGELPASLEVRPEHIYDVIGETESVGKGTPRAEMEISSHELGPSDLTANHELVHSSVEGAQEVSCDREQNPLYAQVSKKSKCPSPILAPDVKEKDEEEKDVSPPLPDKNFVNLENLV